MSSHREAPEISKDPVADNTDVYAFVSPDNARHGHADRQLHPAAEARRRPELLRVRRRRRSTRSTSPTAATAEPDVTYQFRFTHQDPQPEDVPLQHRADQRASATPTWNRPQFYSVTRVKNGKQHGARPRTCPARRSTSAPAARPNYAQLSRRRPCTRSARRKVFAGQRADGFHVDLGSIFDLGALRPFNERAPDPAWPDDGRASTRCRPQRAHASRSRCRSASSPATATCPRDPIGARRGDRRLGDGQPAEVADLRQDDGAVRRPRSLAAGLPAGQPAVQRGASSRWREKDKWNARAPTDDSAFAKYVDQPELAELLPVLYPGVVPEPRGVHEAAGRPERDPADRHPERGRARVPELHRPRRVGHAAAQRRRSRRATTRTRSGWSPATPAGFPNGRRVVDDVVDHRAAGHRRADDPAGRPDVHPGRRRQRDHGRHDEHQRAPTPATFPYLGLPRRRLPDRRPGTDAERVMTRPMTHAPRTRTPGRARCCSTSATTSGRSWSRCRASMVGVEVEIRPRRHGHVTRPDTTTGTTRAPPRGRGEPTRRGRSAAVPGLPRGGGGRLRAVPQGRATCCWPSRSTVAR